MSNIVQPNLYSSLIWPFYVRPSSSQVSSSLNRLYRYGMLTFHWNCVKHIWGFRFHSLSAYQFLVCFVFFFLFYLQFSYIFREYKGSVFTLSPYTYKIRILFIFPFKWWNGNGTLKKDELMADGSVLMMSYPHIVSEHLLIAHLNSKWFDLRWLSARLIRKYICMQ